EHQRIGARAYADAEASPAVARHFLLERGKLRAENKLLFREYLVQRGADSFSDDGVLRPQIEHGNTFLDFSGLCFHWGFQRGVPVALACHRATGLQRRGVLRDCTAPARARITK